MKRLSLALLLLTLGAAPAIAQESATHELAGFSSASLTGGSGVLAFNAACSEFGSDARMCNTLEVARTASPPSVSGSAWVRPVPVGGELEAVAGAAGSSCFGWSSNLDLDNGSLVTAAGSFVSGACGLTYGVACCTPIPQANFASVPDLIPWAMALLGAGMAISAMLLPRVQRRQLEHGGRLLGPGE